MADPDTGIGYDTVVYDRHLVKVAMSTETSAAAVVNMTVIQK
jgi:hypothetical protein